MGRSRIETPLKWKVTLGLLGLWLFITALSWAISAWGLNRAVFGSSPWNYLYHIFFLLVPLAWMVRDRSRARDYCLPGEAWREDWSLGGVLFALLFFPGLVADGLTGNLQLTRWAVQSGIPNTVLFMSVFVAFGEELLYRGFFQGEFNRVWGRPWSFRGTPFGMGMVLTSFLFGVGHLLNPFNPLTGQWDLDWSYFAGTLLLGGVLGLARERANGLGAVTLIHLGLVLHWRLFAFTPYSGSALMVAWFVAALIFGRWILRKEQTP
jgi:membrane protease YdiL (CAAX protease family)